MKIHSTLVMCGVLPPMVPHSDPGPAALAGAMAAPEIAASDAANAAIPYLKRMNPTPPGGTHANSRRRFPEEGKKLHLLAGWPGSRFFCGRSAVFGVFEVETAAG